VTAASAPPAGLVVFRTRGPSWVEVVDARGQTVMRRLMERGEAASATGPLPLMVTVGSVGATDVQVRGRPFDLGPVSRDNVARFEVK
jgi:cytoskeleton protein RodZ